MLRLRLRIELGTQRVFQDSRVHSVLIDNLLLDVVEDEVLVCLGGDPVEAEADRLVWSACDEYPRIDVLDGHRRCQASNQERDVVVVTALVQRVHYDDERVQECLPAQSVQDLKSVRTMESIVLHDKLSLK